MISRKQRREKIQRIQQTIKDLQEIGENWTKETLSKGQDPEKDIALKANKMLLSLLHALLASEKEVLELENLVRKKKKIDAS
jgi:hypothetical protein